MYSLSLEKQTVVSHISLVYNTFYFFGGNGRAPPVLRKHINDKWYCRSQYNYHYDTNWIFQMRFDRHRCNVWII